MAEKPASLIEQRPAVMIASQQPRGSPISMARIAAKISGNVLSWRPDVTNPIFHMCDETAVEV